MVTAETAIVMPFVVLVALTLVGIVSLGVVHLRLADAARESARAVARGETPAEARRAGRALVPGATVRIAVADGRAHVKVGHRARLPLLSRVHVDLSASATAVVE